MRKILCLGITILLVSLFVNREIFASSSKGSKTSPEIIKTLGGENLNFEKGVVLLDFWATWCFNCKKGFPNFLQTASKFDSRGVVSYAVSLDSPEEDLKFFLEDQKIPRDRIGVASLKLMEKFDLMSIPATVILKEGKIFFKETSPFFLSQKTIESNLEKALSGVRSQ